MSTALQKRDAAPEWNPEQVALIRAQLMPGASDAEFEMNMAVAIARRLNPITKQIHFVPRWNKQAGKNVWAHQVSIDGLRTIAERTGLYAGQDEAEYGKDEDGARWCRVKVYRKDWGGRPAVGKVYWEECVQPSAPMWGSKPKLMWAKCAEAAALRKAFPEDTGGLYADDEMPEVSATATVDVLPAARPREATPKALAAPEVLPPASESSGPGVITEKQRDAEATRLTVVIDAAKTAKDLDAASEQVARSREIGLLDESALKNLKAKGGAKRAELKGAAPKAEVMP